MLVHSKAYRVKYTVSSTGGPHERRTSPQGADRNTGCCPYDVPKDCSAALAVLPPFLLLIVVLDLDLVLLALRL